jgi:WD40 repeat protein
MQYKIALASIALAFTSAALLTKCQKQDQSAWITAAVTMHLPADGAGLAVAWSADGKYLVATSRWGGTISVWDRKGDITAHIRSDSGLGPFLNNTISFLESDDQIVTEIPEPATFMKSTIGELSREHLNVWSLKGGHVLFSGGFKERGLSAFAVSPDRKLIVAAPDFARLIRIFSLPDLKQIIDLQTASFPTSLEFLADGHRIAVGEFDGSSTVLDLAGKAEQVSLVHFHEPFRGTIQGQANGEVLAGVGFIAVNRQNGYMAVGPGHGLINLDPRQFSVSSAENSRESQLSAEDKVNRIIILDATLKTVVATYPNHISGVLRQLAWDPTGTFLAFVDHEELVFWSPFRKDLSPVVVNLNDTAMSFAFSPTGGLLAVTTANGVDIYSFSGNK